MKWRVGAALLWVVAGWYAGSMLSALFELEPALAPILASPGPMLVAVGAVAARQSNARRDRRSIWKPNETPLPAGQTRPLETTGT